MSPSLSSSSEPPFEPAQIPSARVLLASDGAVIWEYQVPAYTSYLPRMRQHTVCLCSQPHLQRRLSRLASPNTATDDAWGLLIVPAGEGCQLQTPSPLMSWNISMAPVLLQRAQRAGLVVAATSSPSTGGPTPRLRAAAGIEDPVLESMVLALHHAARGPRPATRQFVDSMANALSAHLVEQHCTAFSPLPDQLGEQDMARLNAFLDSQFSDRCQADDAADMLGMSPSRFVRLLKARTGQSFRGYYMQRRLERSFELLHMGQMSVTEAAFETCFVSLAHFSRVFHKHFGLAPSTLKR